MVGTREGTPATNKDLNRIAIWNNPHGLEYEADTRHVDIILKQLQMTEAKPVSTPGTKEEGRTGEDSEIALEEEEATQYRARVSRCNDLAPYKPDTLFSVKGVAPALAKPTRGDIQKFKRLA